MIHIDHKNSSTSLKGIQPSLFPLSEKLERRTSEIFISCLHYVPEFAAYFLKYLPQSDSGAVNLTKGIDAYLEITGDKQKTEPDAMIIKNYPKGKKWSAIFEFKIKDGSISKEQLERELKFASDNNINALITITNQFTSSPEKTPYKIRANSRVKCFHLSWTRVRTIIATLLANDEDKDVSEQLSQLSKDVLYQFMKYLERKESGCMKFNTMPLGWSQFLTDVTKETMTTNDENLDVMVNAWLQESYDICLELARISGQPKTRLANAFRKLSNDEIYKKTKQDVLKEAKFTTAIEIPLLSSNIDIEAHLKSKNIFYSVSVDAPKDAKSPKEALSWLRKSINNIDSEKIVLTHLNIEVICSSTSKKTNDHACNLIDKINDNFMEGIKDKRIKKFIITYCVEVGGNFNKNTHFIGYLEKNTELFYSEVCIKLPQWIEKPKTTASEFHEETE